MLTQNDTVAFIHDKQRPGHGQTDSTGLSTNAAASGCASNIEAILVFCYQKRFFGMRHKRLATKVINYVFAVNREYAFTRLKYGARHRFFTTSGG